MEPLAATLRPVSLDEYIGQEHVMGVGKPLRVAIEKKHIFSFILWGPPGCGKTTLARIYAKAINAEYHELSAVSASKDDVRQIVEGGDLFGPRVLFLDEIHRFNKAQQDFLLPYVESGRLVLIGATTENPSFEVIAALLSRCRIFVLHELSEDNMRMIIERTGKKIDTITKDFLIRIGGGDARQVLGAISSTEELYGEITIESVTTTLQSRHLRYDKKGEEHYNTISAFIKSMRAGKVNAALYYLARMIDSGEDPLFIARRMIIFASEDVGLADPYALVLANQVFTAVERIGLPEARISLAHGVAYLSMAHKDRRAYDAVEEALRAVKDTGNLPIPLYVRNGETKLMKDIGYGKGYEMYGDMSYMPEEVEKMDFLVDTQK